MHFMTLVMVLSAPLPCAAPALNITTGTLHLQPFLGEPQLVAAIDPDQRPIEPTAYVEVNEEGWLPVLALPAQKTKAEIPAAVTASLETASPSGNTDTKVLLPVMLTR